MRLLDIARSAYVASPAGFRRRIAPLMAMVPTSLKYGGSYRRWREAIETARKDFPFVAERQRSALSALLQAAHAGSTFHRAHIERAFGTDATLSALTPDDLVALPILTKDDLRAAGDAALAVPRDQLDRATTSGSNGEVPFAFHLDRDRSVREIAFIHDAWTRAGFKPGDARAMLRDAYLYDRPGFIHEWEAALNELRLSVFPMKPADIDLYLDMMDARAIRYLHGFPSAMEIMARHMIASGRRLKLPLKGVFPISEPIYPHQRDVLRQAFGGPEIVPFYGMSEKAIFAVEVEGEDGVYECDPLYGIAELVDDDGRPVRAPGREGRLVGTSFVTTGMPFIRYDTEDRAMLVRPAGAENGWRMRVRDITPRRKPAFLIGSAGEKLVGTDFTPTEPALYAGIKEFQFHQERAGYCTLRYVSDEAGTEQDAERLCALLQEKAGDTIRFTLERCESLVASPSGKRPFIDQQIRTD